MERGGQKFSKFQMHHITKCDTLLESWCSEVSENILYNMFVSYPPPLIEWEGGGKKFQNFKCIIEPSVIHRWKAGVLRFLKTYYTVCFRFCKFLQIYKGGG